MGARFAVLTILAAATFGGLTAVANAKPVTIGGETNLRKSPGTKSEVVVLIPKGETVELGACDAGWCEVTWNGQSGYAIARNLGQVTRSAAANPAPRRVVRRYVEDGDYDGAPPAVYEEGPEVEPYVAGPPVYYGYYRYPYPYWYGGYGWRGGGWHHHRRW
ncbi:MAG: SH3 domain-containing protein [Pseudolabrys sp.]